GFFHDLEHHRLRLADRESADGVTRKTDVDEPTRILDAQRRIVTALHDAEQRAARRRTFERALAALGPAQREPHGALDFVARGRQPQAFVELHHDIGAEQNLNL